MIHSIDNLRRHLHRTSQNINLLGTERYEKMMKQMRDFYLLVVLTVIALGVGTADAQENLARQAYAIFQQNCLNCHGPDGPFTEELVIESAQGLIDSGVVVPGNAIGSEFYQRLLPNKEDGHRMPLNQPPLPTPLIVTIRNWIKAGAPSWEIQHDVDFISTAEMLNAIQEHLETLSPFNRPFARYFTLTHLYNAGELPEALSAYQIALSKLINSLSWGFDIEEPLAMGPAGTIFYIDLRNYEWDTNDAWTSIEDVYPYAIEFDVQTQAPLRDKLMHLREEMACEVPYVYVDWFLATAALPPLYHDILDLPQTDRELERRLEVDVARNLQAAPGVRVWRAGFNDSGVSNHNRVVERHTSRYGAYWKSYDFAGSVGAQNIFTHPLSFRADGGEVIFNLPNGLQAYYISDAQGNRIDVAPTTIVSNPAASDPAVHNGLSCIGCHTEGMKTFEDSVRSVVDRTVNPPFDKEQALRLYVEQGDMNELVAADTDRYREALKKTGGIFGGIEPVHRFFEVYQGPVDAAYAAASVGLETREFREQIHVNPSLQSLGLLSLVDETGNVKRDVWASRFQEIVRALNSPHPNPTVVVTSTRPIPTGTVHIPDARLRAAIASALGKAAGTAQTAPITAEEMATLTRLDPERKGIRELTGLEAAINLEELHLSDNRISDISPLSGLIRLRNLTIRKNFISDISALANLRSLDWIDLHENLISDLSPLSGLVKLGGLKISGNRLSDLSPLAGLISLRQLHAYGNEISDLTPLTRLPNLTYLHLAHNRISDVSALAGLRHLTELYIYDNNISDISALAGLSRLTELNLRDNNISDFSPLDSLRENTEVTMNGNPGFPSGGPKITGPWLWVLVPGTRLNSSTDFLSLASDGTVTERKVATNGATEGNPVGEGKWRVHTLSATGWDNINEMTAALGWGTREEIYEHIVYGSVSLESPRRQETTMFVGSDDAVKVWLNGKLVHQALVHRGAGDYQDFFPVTLKQGKNVLLVAVDNRGHGGFSGFFGFAPDAEYTVLPPGARLSASANTSGLSVGDSFTLHLRVEEVKRLAGWQFDIGFDPAVLRATRVNEGPFLKADTAKTYTAKTSFESGTIDNGVGKISGLSVTRLDPGGVTGSGKLMSIRFVVRALGETELVVSNLEFGSRNGAWIPTSPPKILLHLGVTARRVQIGERAVPAAASSAAVPTHLTAEQVIQVLRFLRDADDGSVGFERAIANLEQLLGAMLPERTALLANYPNPFNPETWIPYHLATGADVQIRIYASSGALVRTLALGHQAAGHYQTRSRAAYWDGKNQVGEAAASGTYFYTLTAGDFTSTRKMLIVK